MFMCVCMLLLMLLLKYLFRHIIINNNSIMWIEQYISHIDKNSECI